MTKPERNGVALGLLLGLLGWALLTAPWWSRPLDEMELYDVPAACVHQGKLP